MEKSIVVFGGSGFLGSHVADALTSAGYRVKIFDCKHSPYLQPKQEMIIGDIMDYDSVLSAVKDCEVVFNFAGIADIDDAIHRPIDTANLNIIGNLHILEACRHTQVKRFVFASSVYVFSQSGAFYRASKQSCEHFIETYYERYGLEYTILRYGTLYGRRADKRNNIYRLIQQGLREKKITYHGAPEAMRDYIHVEDAARLSVAILKDEFINRHIVLTGTERMSVQQLMKMIAEILPGDVELEFTEQKLAGHYVMTPYSFHPKIGQKLISNAQVDMGQGILDCISEQHQELHQHENFEYDIEPLS